MGKHSENHDHEVHNDDDDDESDHPLSTELMGVGPISEYQRHRSLLIGAGMGGICWDCGQGMTNQKQVWAEWRTEAINSLIQYFGSLNSGSIGWCENTKYYNKRIDGKCKPVMARQGWLPWMNPDSTPKETCP